MVVTSMHAHGQIHTHTHVHIHACIHTLNTHMHAHTHAYVHIHACAHTHHTQTPYLVATWWLYSLSVTPANTLARPKSAILRWPVGLMSRFAGFKSYERIRAHHSIQTGAVLLIPCA